MARKITLTDAKTKESYVIEYDRDSILYAESIGFDATKAQGAIATDMVTLFRAGFHKNHPLVGKDVVYEMWDRISDKQGLFSILMQMFQEPYEALLSEPAKDSKGNVTWEATE